MSSAASVFDLSANVGSQGGKREVEHIHSITNVPESEHPVRFGFAAA